MENNELLPGERLDDLQREGLKLIQDPSKFCFGMDAVLLSEFTFTKKEDSCVDLCCGNGVIPILMAGRGKGSHFTGLEIQEDVAEMARRSVRYNELESKVEICIGDIREATTLLGLSKYDVVTCNPPYMTSHHGLTNNATPKAIARHEILCNLDDVLEQGTRLLKPGGHFFMVHRPFRLAEILSKMVGKRLEPKRMRLVYPFVDKEPNMVLIEGVRGGNSRIQVEKPLIVYDEQGNYTEEIYRIYDNNETGRK